MVMIAGGLAFSLASWWGIGLAVALWIGSMAALQRMGKADPLLRHVYLRHIRYTAYLSGEERPSRSAIPRRPRTGGDVRMQITRTSIRARGLADLLLPFALIEDGILLQQDGSLLAGWSYRGPDMHSATHCGDACSHNAAEFDSPAWAVDGCSTRISSVPAHRAIRIRALSLTP